MAKRYGNDLINFSYRKEDKTMKKTEKDMIEKIYLSREAYLDLLSLKIESLHKCLENLKSKIKNEGHRGYYSCNSDVIRYSQEIWKACNSLCVMKEIEQDLIKKSSKKKRKK